MEKLNFLISLVFVFKQLMLTNNFKKIFNRTLLFINLLELQNFYIFE